MVSIIFLLLLLGLLGILALKAPLLLQVALFLLWHDRAVARAVRNRYALNLQVRFRRRLRVSTVV